MKRSKKAFFQLCGPATFCFAALCFGCTPNQRILESSNSSGENVNISDNTAPALKDDSIEKEIQAMRNADFFFIYVFRRKDGGVLDADDKRFMASVIPAEINRKTLADGEKALVTGSNFHFPPDAWKQMIDRYEYKDYSSPESEIMGTNSKTNATR